MSKALLIKRLRWYYPTELFNVFLFSAIGIWLLFEFSFPDIVFLLYGLFLMILILYQGQHYWKLKLKRLQGNVINQESELQFFRYSRKLNIILIGLIPFILLLQLYLNNWILIRENFIGWAISANVFGVLEYVNYYHLQLMIDNEYDIEYIKINKKLKVSSLKKDLIENEI